MGFKGGGYVVFRSVHRGVKRYKMVEYVDR